MAETRMKMPALAVVGPDRRIVRSTETFRRRYEGAEKMCELSPEIEGVLAGHADVATLTLGGMSVAIEAVMDAAGRRQAMLTLPPAESAPAVEPPLSALRDAAEKSPAIVWVKDLQGRYLFANPRYVNDFATSEERLLGSTDAELPEMETVDGPRRRYVEDGVDGALQLEYAVPAVDGRPALAVFRFALRDETGQPVATCGVATPAAEAQVARDEAVRLMELERWNRLDPIDVRAELLEQWHVQAAPPRPAEHEADEAPPAAVAEEAEAAAAPSLEPEPGPPAREPEAAETISRPKAVPMPAPPPTSASAPAAPNLVEELQGELLQAQAHTRQAESDAQKARVAAARATEEADRWRTEAEAARRELAAARAETESLRGPSTAALRLSEELGRSVAAERERGEELERMLGRLRSRLADFESALAPGPIPSARSPITP